MQKQLGNLFDGKLPLSQYISKSEYSMNLRINTHRNDMLRVDDHP